jgi:hypothetical protein
MGFWTLSSVRYEEHGVSETVSVSALGDGVGDTCSVGSDRKSYVMLLEYRTMDKVPNPSNPECYTPSSEPFRIHSRSLYFDHPFDI